MERKSYLTPLTESNCVRLEGAFLKASVFETGTNGVTTTGHELNELDGSDVNIWEEGNTWQ